MTSTIEPDMFRTLPKDADRSAPMALFFLPVRLAKAVEDCTAALMFENTLSPIPTRRDRATSGAEKPLMNQLRLLLAPISLLNGASFVSGSAGIFSSGVTSATGFSGAASALATVSSLTGFSATVAGFSSALAGSGFSTGGFSWTGASTGLVSWTGLASLDRPRSLTISAAVLVRPGSTLRATGSTRFTAMSGNASDRPLTRSAIALPSSAAA